MDASTQKPVSHSGESPYLQQKLKVGPPEQQDGRTMAQKYGQNQRLEQVFQDGSPVRFGESGEAVRVIQEGFIGDGFSMPQSFTSDGEMDGVFGSETFAKTKQFQARYYLKVDGIIGQQTLMRLSVLPSPSYDFPPVCLSLSYLNAGSSEQETRDRVLPAFEASSPNPLTREYDRPYCHYIGCPLTTYCDSTPCSLHFCDETPCDICPDIVITASCFYRCLPDGERYAFILLTRFGFQIGPICP